MSKRRLLLASLPALAWAQAAAAQPPGEPTNITPDTAAPLSLDTTTTRAGNVTTIDGGTRAGPNLFHSFSRFDLGQGDIARWAHSSGDPAAIAHVVNRVTGGDPSNINGQIDSTALPNAYFWFINPAGVIFGQGAQLNVPAAAHFATAQELRFAVGPAFTVGTPGGSTFSISDPAAFGFLGGQGAIAMANPGLAFLPPNASLTLAGSDVSITGGNFAATALRLYGVGSDAVEIGTRDLLPAGLGGRVTLTDTDITLTEPVGGGSDLAIGAGTIEIARSDIVSSGGTSSILLHGDEVTISRSLLSSATTGATDAGDIIVSGGDIRIIGSFLTSEAAFGSTGAAGDISLFGERVTIADGSFVTSATLSDRPGGAISIEGDEVEIAFSVVSSSSDVSTGQAGPIDITGGFLTLHEDSLISSGTSGLGAGGGLHIDMRRGIRLERGVISSASTGQGLSGDSGFITILTPELRLGFDSGISTSTVGSGAAGVIMITAGEILLDGGSMIESRAVLGSTGPAGLVLIGTGSLSLTGGSRISSETAGAGDAGAVLVFADTVDLVDSSISSGSVRACDECDPAQGAGGGVFVRANRLTMRGSNIASDNQGGPRNAGEILLELGSLDMREGSFITTITSGSGNSGTISIRGLDDDSAPSILMDDSRIASNTFGEGSGGTIDIRAADFTLDNQSQILGRSGFPGGADFAFGRGGDITIAAANLFLLGNSEISGTALGTGDAGDIDISIEDRLVVGEFSAISANAQSTGNGGAITLTARQIEIGPDGTVEATAERSRAGDINISTQVLSMIGSPPVDDMLFNGPATISTTTSGVGPAGSIGITADTITMFHAVIESNTLDEGTAPAGTIHISTGDLFVGDMSRISTSAGRDCAMLCSDLSGDAGTIGIVASGDVVLTGLSEILSSSLSGTGNAGQIGIMSRTLLISGGRIASGARADSLGRSGTVAIATGSLTIEGAGSIETISNNANEAGGIFIEAPRIALIGDRAAISSANGFTGVGNAGAIFMTTEQLSLIDGARITTSSLSGAAGTIEIFMPETGLLRLESRGEPSLITTSSGPGTGGRIFIGSPLAIISNGGSILALGEEGGANVEIITDYFIRSSDLLNRVAVDGSFLLEATAGDISSGTVTRDLSVIDASGVLRGQCASARASGQVSQLVVRPIGPYGDRSVPAVVPPPAAGAETTGTCF